MMSKNRVKNKSFRLAIKVVKLYQFIQTEKKEYILSKQLVRSGTSVGANIREAEHSESKADFIHKMAIAQKEINETIYLVRLIKRNGLFDYRTIQKHT